MGQLFDRFSRLVRAELNSRQLNSEVVNEEKHLSGGSVLAAGGAVAGASLGKVGILAGGTGYSLGALPLAAIGGLTGAALYEVLRSILDGDASSVSAAVTGAAAGAATSAAIGSVGVAVGGGAIGIGMASMAAGGAMVALGLAGINRLLQQGLDPEKLLDRAIEQMEVDLCNARQASINILASQKRLQQLCNQAEANLNKWERRTQLALKKGDEFLARQAMIQQKLHVENLNSLKTQLSQEPTSVKNLKLNLTLLEAKIAEAKMLRIRLTKQMAIARANGLLGSRSLLSQMNASSAMAAFERMEEKVRQMESHSQVVAELTDSSLESQFIQIQPGDDLDDMLAEMKKQLLGGCASSQGQFPSSAPANTVPQDAAIDAELEELKKQLDQL